MSRVVLWETVFSCDNPGCSKTKQESGQVEKPSKPWLSGLVVSETEREYAWHAHTQECVKPAILAVVNRIF